MESLLFVTSYNHLYSDKIGGVQICTKEYWSLLENAGFNIIPHTIQHTRNYLERIKIKLGIDLYSRYDFRKDFNQIKSQVNTLHLKYIALNQVDLIKFAKLIKQEFGENVVVIILSHGNETGDFLHHIVRNKYNFLKKLRDKIRLGFALFYESYYFTYFVDTIISVSETEKEVNNWIGAKQSIFIPRTFSPDFVNWKPINCRVGFVGTLNHMPNYQGLIMFLETLLLCPNKIKVRIIGRNKKEGLEIENEYPDAKFLGEMDENDLKEEISTWNFFLNPVFWYSRGVSTKLAQAIKYGIPIISTQAGNRGYFWQKGDILTVNTPDEMKDKILYYLQNKKELEQLAESVRLVSLNGPDIKELGQELKNQLFIK